MRRLFAGIAATAAFLTVGAGCAGTKTPAPDAIPEIRPGIPAGYPAPSQLPGSLALVPAPPASDSAAFAQDEAASTEARAHNGTPRRAQATADAELHFPEAAGTLSCALHAPVTKEGTPALVGAGAVALLHADPAFQADLEASKAELAAMHTLALEPTRDCDAEASSP